MKSSLHSLFLSLVIGAFLLSACAKTATLPKNASAEAYFKAASIDMEHRLYPEAAGGFENVRIKYPYSPLAPLATLRVGDCRLKNGDHLEAIESYRLFLQLYPRHAEVPYATYRIGECHLARAPKDYFFMPPAYEKDLAPIKQGVGILQDFLKRYSASTYTEEARRLLEEGQSRLIMHELYVADFNYKRKQYNAAFNRAMGLIDAYPEAKLHSAAYLVAAQSALKMDNFSVARSVAQLIIKDYPESKEAKKAGKLLKKIDRGEKNYQKKQEKKEQKEAKKKTRELNRGNKADSETDSPAGSSEEISDSSSEY